MEDSPYRFVTFTPSGMPRREWSSIKEAFDGKQPGEQVYVVLVETGGRTVARFKVLRP